METKYIEVSQGAMEAIQISKFISELVMISSTSDAMDLYCYNGGTIAEAKEPKTHQKNKHAYDHLM